MQRGHHHRHTSDVKTQSTTTALRRHATRIRKTHLAGLFEDNPGRFREYHRCAGDLLYDFSRQRIDDTALSLLFDLAREHALPEEVGRLFNGEPLNYSENRPALHWALRLPENRGFTLEGIPVSRNNREQLARMEELATRIHGGQWKGATGRPVTDVVNIGVGGSGMGPLMSCRALQEFSGGSRNRVNLHFVSGMDGSDIASIMESLSPETTLFVVSSKSFGTIDTLTNATTARHWLARHLGESTALMRRHFIGISAKRERMSDWGIHPEHQLELGEWVGGRYSIWSTIGFPLLLQIGMEGFRAFLDGAHMMDRHFATTTLEDNLPVLMGLISIWNTNYLQIPTSVLLPYDGRLEKLPDYLQQLEMESNGKSVTRDGRPVHGRTCPVIWGGPGYNAQHAFFQLLHQGTEVTACEFIACARRYHGRVPGDSGGELLHHHRLALANLLSHARLLAFGDQGNHGDDASHSPYLHHPGNRPVSCLLLRELTPFNLGALIALYEHKVFVQSVLWGLNPFDQWGVERGKACATGMLALLEGRERGRPDLDPATEGLVRFVQQSERDPQPEAQPDVPG